MENIIYDGCPKWFKEYIKYMEELGSQKGFEIGDGVMLGLHTLNNLNRQIGKKNIDFGRLKLIITEIKEIKDTGIKHIVIECNDPVLKFTFREDDARNGDISLIYRKGIELPCDTELNDGENNEN